MALDARIQDYLDDKLQTFADFEALDSLIANIESQQDLLKQQLVEAENDLEHARSEADTHHKEAREKSKQFKDLQDDIDKRLIIITNSDTADEAIDQFDGVMAALRRVDLADGYLGMLQDVKRIDESVRDALHTDPENAVREYTELYTLIQGMIPLQEAAEGAAPHLLDFLDKIRSKLELHLKEEFSRQLDDVLQKILWPKKTVAIPMSLLDPFNASFSRLLALQRPQLEQRLEVLDKESLQSRPLFPLEVLISPLAQRFQYHFSGDRPTNRLDKPEYFFSHFFDILNTHLEFITEYIQPLLLEHFNASKLSMSTAYFDATTAFITALLPLVRQRVLSILPAVSQQPQLLSHLISELLAFDNTLRNDWRYDGGDTNVSEQWKGLTWEVLTLHGHFDHWLSVEHQFAVSRYESIEGDSSAYTLDFDAVSSLANTSVPTTAAIRIYELLTSITATYRDVPSFSHRARFLLTIQIDILDQFHKRLNSALEAYMARTSSVGRTVQGVSAGELAELQGVGGLDHLCRIYGSAEYLEKAMRDWGDDVFFLDMWFEMQSRVRNRDSMDVVKGPMSVTDIANKTSKSLNSEEHGEEAEGALFDETAGHYARLRERAEGVITSTLSHSVRESLRSYAKSASFASSSDENSISTSPDLSVTIQMLSSGLSFLGRALAAAPLRRVVRAVTQGMDDFIFDRVILARDFSASGAKQFSVDVRAILGTLESALGRKAGRIRLRRCEDSAKLLNLPLESPQREKESEEEKLTLWSVESKLFATNEDARAVLADLGCASLTEAEARKVLRCRVELTS